MPTLTAPRAEMTAEELGSRIGAIPLWRVRSDPPPGTATIDDVERLRREENRLCELINGVLVEKAVSSKTSALAVKLVVFLDTFVSSRQLGWIFGPDGFVHLFPAQLRAPDASFVARDQLPDERIPDSGYIDVAPLLAVEIFSPGNTAGEMEQKRHDFFAAGTEQFWVIYPDRQEIEVYSDPQTCRTLGRNETLDGGSVLPGFTVPVADLFGSIHLDGND